MREREVELFSKIVHQRGRFELLSILLGDMLKERGVNIDYLFEASKDEIAHELIRYRKSKVNNDTKTG